MKRDPECGLNLTPAQLVRIPFHLLITSLTRLTLMSTRLKYKYWFVQVLTDGDYLFSTYLRNNDVVSMSPCVLSLLLPPSFQSCFGQTGCAVCL